MVRDNEFIVLSVFCIVTKQKRKDLNSQKVNKRFKMI